MRLRVEKRTHVTIVLKLPESLKRTFWMPLPRGTIFGYMSEMTCNERLGVCS